VLRLHVVDAERNPSRVASVEGRAVRIVAARIRCRVAIVGPWPFAALRRWRRRAIPAWPAVRVDDAIAPACTSVGGTVGRRATANARRARRTIRVADALVVRTRGVNLRGVTHWPLVPAFALRVRRAAVGGPRGTPDAIAGTPLRWTGRGHGPVVHGTVRVARARATPPLVPELPPPLFVVLPEPDAVPPLLLPLPVLLCVPLSVSEPTAVVRPPHPAPLHHPPRDAVKGPSCKPKEKTKSSRHPGVQTCPVSASKCSRRTALGVTSMVPNRMGKRKRRGPTEPGLNTHRSPSRATSGTWE